MKNRRLVPLLLVSCATALGTDPGLRPPLAAPKPLYDNPDYHGACDPEVIWNTQTREWWIFYTARRATRGIDSYVGTPIGVIASPNLRDWRSLGYVSLDDRPGGPDLPVTYWAPALIRHGDTYHLFLTYKDNATPPWGGPGVLRHYAAPAADLLNGWKLVASPAFGPAGAADATLIRIGDTFRACYRAGDNGIHWSASKDLLTWQDQGPVAGEVNAAGPSRSFGRQDGPCIFSFGGSYWLLTDPQVGLAVYQSADALTWRYQGRILEQPGTGPQDATIARHPTVALAAGRAFLIYHTEPHRLFPAPPLEQRAPAQKIACLQIAELRITSGQLTCARDAAVIPPAEVEPPAGGPIAVQRP